ncbi:MAG: 3-isopropylmalate dehydratase small subunit [Candidatus Altiarchaeales archaeon ex4484_2]|nr:MAG: 3-isopropylmalate dehydratase small subunit [Candidatus Altiarchaeales archaeon ex4484_2]
MVERIEGRVWLFGDNVDTDQIIPAEYLVTGDMNELAQHAFERVRPGFSSGVEEGDLIVAGENFGCGSSREHAPRALIGAGVSCVIAKSFARIFYRNSINIGLPVVECDVQTGDGDRVEVDFKKGRIRNLTTGVGYDFPSMPPFVLRLVESGGLISYVKKQLAEGGRA